MRRLLAAAADLDRVRSVAFNVLLLVSATASASVALGPDSPFYEPSTFAVVRVVTIVWVALHAALWLLARRRPLAAYVTYLYAAFAVLAFGYQSTTVDWFTRLNMLMQGTYCASIGGVLLLPFPWYLAYSTSVTGVLAFWIVVAHDHFLPPHGSSAAPSVFASVVGAWALSVACAGLLALFYRRMNSARHSLASLNARLKDEVAAQAGTIRHHQEKLFETQKLEAIGLLAGGVAHDFNNKLTVISHCTELLDMRLRRDPEARSLIATLRSSTEDSARLTRQLLSFSRKEAIQPRVVSLNAFISDRREMFSRLLGGAIEYSPRLSPDAGNCMIDPGQLEQILINLLVNARDAMPEGGLLELTTVSETIGRGDPRIPPGLPAGRYAVLSVRDTGVGMDSATVSRLFEPFFTTKARGKGTGLGLATVHGAVRQNGGHIAVESMPGAGTAFVIRLPWVALEPEQATREPDSPIPRSAEATILLVDDEVRLASVIGRVLAQAGYVVLTATGPADALHIARHHGGPIDVVITDITMPDGGGRRVVDEVCALHPGTKVILMSAYSPDSLPDAGPEHPAVFLRKPFMPRVLLDKVEEILMARG